MKINISIGKPPISGYTNFDLTSQPFDINSLNNLCEPAECVELLLDETLHYIPLQQIPQFLSALITRLRRNGKIIISGFDINECIKMYQNGRMSLADINLVLFGHEKLKHVSCISYYDIEKILKENNLQIYSIELDSEKFTIIGQRK